MASDVGIRKELIGRGVSNDLIGFDPNTGYVTVGGQNFIKPQKNFQGTTFTDRPSFNQAYNQYQSPKTTQPTQGAVQPTPVTQPSPVQTTPYVNPADAQINDLIAKIMNQMNNPQSFDPYASPEFAAQEARSGRAAQEGIRAAQESLGSAGFGRSTTLGQTAQREQNVQEEYLRTQVIPQIIAQNEQRKQQELANQMALLNPLMSQQGTFDLRNQFGQNLALQEGQLTGDYMPPAARSIIDNILELKRQAEQKDASGRNIIQGQDLAALSSQADVLRNQLRGMKIDTSMIGADVTAGTATQNRANLGIPTLEAQKLQYQQVRDAILDQQDKQEFDEDVRRWGLEYATDKAYKQGQLDISRMGAETSRGQLELSRSKENLDNLYRQWETTRIAPEGIPGIAAGTPLPQEATADISKIISDLSKLYVSTNPVTGQRTISDPEALRAAIIGRNLSDDDTDTALLQFGLEIKEDE